MRITAKNKTVGFTLIELLTVIAIIGILAAIIIPTVGTVREKAQRAVDSNNIREVLKAAQIYAGDNNDRLPDPQTSATLITGGTAVYRWPGILAKNNILTDPSFYVAKYDPLYPANGPTARRLHPRPTDRRHLERHHQRHQHRRLQRHRRLHRLPRRQRKFSPQHHRHFHLKR